MSQLDDIIAPVSVEFNAFRKLLNDATLSERPFMQPITRNILHTGGKQMRPLLTLLTAALHGKAQEPQVLSAAILIEMIHWSTLVHDDVIDEAYLRRGEWTPGTLLRSKSAILVGDYLFSKGLAQASHASSFGAIRSATTAIELIVDGELMQMEYSRRMETTEDIYTEIIRLKTASLLASAAECGVIYAGGNSGAQIAQGRDMYRFGELLGLAFQIKDDLLDLGFAEDGSRLTTGKRLCNDLRERKMTLPLIHALEDLSSGERRQALRHLRRAANYDDSVVWLCDFIGRSSGVAYALTVMGMYHDEAVSLLVPYPDSPVKRALTAYAAYVVGRDF